MNVDRLSYCDEIIPTSLCAQTYAILRTWTAHDTCGTVSCTQVISVQDTLPPLTRLFIGCPLDVEMSFDGSEACDSVSNFIDDIAQQNADDLATNFVDFCSPNVFGGYVVNPDPTPLRSGTYTVEYYVEDECGNRTALFCPHDFIIEVASDIGCKDINVSLDQQCSAEIIPEMVLTNDVSCFDNYVVDLTDQWGQPVQGNVVDYTHLQSDFNLQCYGYNQRQSLLGRSDS